jgi:hypothetical protein
MNVKITVTSGAGKSTNQRSHSILMKDVVFASQVAEVLDSEFKEFFSPQAKLGEVKAKK